MLLEIDCLLRVDDETRQGALRFAERDGGPFLAVGGRRRIPPLVELLKLLFASERIVGETDTDEDLRLLLGPGSSLGGAPAEGFRARPRREALALSLANLAGIPVPEWRIESVANKNILLVRRFDRADGCRVPFLSAISMLARRITNPAAIWRSWTLSADTALSPRRICAGCGGGSSSTCWSPTRTITCGITVFFMSGVEAGDCRLRTISTPCRSMCGSACSRWRLRSTIRRRLWVWRLRWLSILAFRYARPVELPTKSVSPCRAGAEKPPVLASRLQKSTAWHRPSSTKTWRKRGRCVVDSDTLAISQTFRYAVLPGRSRYSGSG